MDPPGTKGTDDRFFTFALSVLALERISKISDANPKWESGSCCSSSEKTIGAQQGRPVLRNGDYDIAICEIAQQPATRIRISEMLQRAFWDLL